VSGICRHKDSTAMVTESVHYCSLFLSASNELRVRKARPRQVFLALAGGASATAASVVSRRNVNVSCKYKRTAESVWLR
jgi:hypothetical protein